MRGQLIDLAGRIFGRLTVLSKEGKNKKGEARWRCRCECGNITIVSSLHLRRSDVKSCGCLRRERGKRTIAKIHENSIINRELAAFNKLYGSYKSRAKTKKLNFSLTPAEAKNLFTSNCYYCGAIPSLIYKSSYEDYVYTRVGNFIYNGIDRKNNDEGYDLKNCVPCCKTCNIAKKAASSEQFLNWITRVYKNLCQ